MLPPEVMARPLCSTERQALRLLAEAVIEADNALDVDLGRACAALRRARGVADLIATSQGARQ